MTLLVAAPVRRAAALAASVLVLAGASAGAQSELSHIDDASPVPRGMLRLRVTTAWTRFDQRYGPNGLVSLGDELSADPLGTTQLPNLAPIESAIQSLAGDPRMRLSLGRLVVRGDTRIVTTPIAMELGVTRRLSIGVVVPIVQTRRTITADVNSATGSPANVGFVSADNRTEAMRQNGAAAASYSAAAAKLDELIARCGGTPGGTGCSAYAADPAGAAAALALAKRFAAAATALGTGTSPAYIAPRANGDFALEIEMQRNALNARLLQYLGAGATPPVSSIYYAPTSFSYIDLQGRNGTPGLLQSPIAGGLDSLATSDRLNFGDIAVGARFLVYDGFQPDSMPVRGLQSRLAIGGSVRFATSIADTVTNLVDIGTGNGAALELNSAWDVIVGRMGGTVGMRVVKPLARTVTVPVYGDPDAGGFPLPLFGQRSRTLGTVFGLDLTPRYLLSSTLSLDGVYGLERIGATSYGGVFGGATDPAQLPFCLIASCAAPAGTSRTAQRLGVGFRYSTVDAYARGQTHFPVEASFTHLTTISGDPGVEKSSRDQVQLRLYFRMFGQ